jgi:hypothetical protein
MNPKQYSILPLSVVTILAESECPDTDSIEWMADNTIWGTYGKNGDQPLKWVNLKNADTDHLEAILDTQKHISRYIRDVIEYILKGRK